MTQYIIDSEAIEKLPKIRLREDIPESMFQTREVPYVRLADIRALLDQSPSVSGEAVALQCGVSRAEWHDKAWALFHTKTFEDSMLHKVNMLTIRAVFDATYDALYTTPQPDRVAMLSAYKPQDKARE